MGLMGTGRELMGTPEDSWGLRRAYEDSWGLMETPGDFNWNYGAYEGAYEDSWGLMGTPGDCDGAFKN